MDIAVTGIKIDGIQGIAPELQKLAREIQNWPCIESFKAIETASIPVIKMVKF